MATTLATPPNRPDIADEREWHSETLREAATRIVAELEFFQAALRVAVDELNWAAVSKMTGIGPMTVKDWSIREIPALTYFRRVMAGV